MDLLKRKKEAHEGSKLQFLGFDLFLMSIYVVKINKFHLVKQELIEFNLECGENNKFSI